MWLAPLLLAASAATSATEQPRDPLAVAFFEICPALLAGTLKPDRAEALADFGFRSAKTQTNRLVIIPVGSSDVIVEADLVPGLTCPVNLQQGTAEERKARLLRVLEDHRLKVETLPSPIGGDLINSTDQISGKVRTSTQAFPNYMVTLIPPRAE